MINFDIADKYKRHKTFHDYNLINICQCGYVFTFTDLSISTSCGVGWTFVVDAKAAGAEAIACSVVYKQ